MYIDICANKTLIHLILKKIIHKKVVEQSRNTPDTELWHTHTTYTHTPEHAHTHTHTYKNLNVLITIFVYTCTMTHIQTSEDEWNLALLPPWQSED